jgi:hypothetical protein
LSFIGFLKDNGWKEISSIQFKKNNWNIIFDTSSWIEVGTKNTHRIFDVPIPTKDQEHWTLNLIEHLCKTDDMLNELG